MSQTCDLDLKIANDFVCFCSAYMSLTFMMINDHIKVGYKMLSGAEDIFWTKARQTDMVIAHP